MKKHLVSVESSLEDRAQFTTAADPVWITLMVIVVCKERGWIVVFTYVGCIFMKDGGLYFTMGWWSEPLLAPWERFTLRDTV